MVMGLLDLVCRLDLEGVVAKKMEDSYGPKTKWLKILNPTYSQKEGRRNRPRRKAQRKPQLHFRVDPDGL